MKIMYLWIVRVEEGEVAQVKGKENMFNKIIEEKFPNLKAISQEARETYRIPNRSEQKKIVPQAT